MSLDMNQFLRSLKNPDDIKQTMKLIIEIQSPKITIEKYLKLYAGKGNVKAQFTLGSKYYTGDGVEKRLHTSKFLLSTRR